MQKYPAVIGVLAASICLWMGIGNAARLPEGLPNLLKTHNFNMYPAPCPANNMVLQDLTGRVVDLNALRGKVVLLNFWRIDCPPCTVEKPILERLHRKYAHRGLEIVAVNLFDDYDRVKAYASRFGFGFRLCSDPEKRFSVQKQSLSGGMPSTFIVNDKSEAIYEVPGVPTSYLIDRNGQVIGNGVGMVNWEEGPFAALIESLLGPPRALAAQTSDSFSDIARQGPVADPAVKQAGPRRTGETPSRLAEPQPRTRPPLPDKTDESAVQGLGPTKHPSSHSSTATEPETVRKDVEIKRSRTEATEPARTKPKPRAAKRSADNSVKPVVELGKPKPYRAATQPAGNAGEVTPVPRHVAQADPGSRPPTPYVPPRPEALTGPPPAGQTAPPALPAAMPYTPPNIPTARKPAPPPVVPDENGQIMARVPSRFTPSTEQDIQSQTPAPSTGSPFASPAIPTNPIDTFILDSFEKGSVRQPARPQALYPEPDRDRGPGGREHQPEQQESAPASSILGQLGRDMRDLGSGIRQTFSGWLPAR
ncbi:MAG: redoxin domain-containing protein [Desulfomonilaceae bacterium]|nr:redoxin domain-containing protein [Desulfomonilaceae bacterium]